MAKRTLTWKKLYIARTNGTGEGLFAKVNFKKGDLIFTWEGVLKKGRYPWYVGDRWLQIEKCQWIAPLRNNPGWYINPLLQSKLWDQKFRKNCFNEKY